MNKIAIYPGTFDPITNGHIDVIERATKIFDKVIVVIAVNSKKVNLFSEKERFEMVQSSLSSYSNVSVDLITGLLVEYAALNNASAIIRGVRSVTDFEYEMQIALMNRKMQPEIQTIFMMPNEKYTYLNSSIIREISRYGQDTSEFVPDIVRVKLKEKFDDLNKS
jgi:pantetheine-phosphate adenylyltransferase